MFPGNFVPLDAYLESDLKWIKNELEGLTKQERRLILDEYERKVKQFGVGMKEYNAILKLVDKLEE